MKKIKYLLLALISGILFMGSVSAADFSTYISGPNSVVKGETFSVEVGINGGSNFAGVTGAFSYDANKLTLSSSSGLNGFNLTLGGNLVVDSATGKSGNFGIAKLTFVAKDSFDIGQSTTISFSNILAGDGNNEFTGGNSSLTITVSKPKNTNNNLKSLSVSEGKINFNKKTTSYTIVVENKVDSITVNAEVEDATAKVTGTGKHKLNVYANSIPVTVTAENGSKKTYTIIVNRKDEKGNAKKLSDVNTLSSLEIEGFNIEFDPETKEYDIKIKDLTEKLVITATAEDENAKVEVSDATLVVGENVINITVTSESGKENVYKINAFKVDVCTECGNKTKCPTVKKANNTKFIIPIVLEGVAILGLVAYIIISKKKH